MWRLTAFLVICFGCRAAAVPRSEYPQPQFERERWLSLNGSWEFAFDDANAGLAGQLGHRDQDPRIKGADTDFPEPGGSPEHSGEDSKSKEFVKKKK